MNTDLDDTASEERRSPDALAQLLVGLYDRSFGGALSGKFRISRKFLRKLAGRRKLPDAFLDALAEEMFEIGFVFVDCESYSIILNQKQFASYRRVTSVAVNKVTSYEKAKTELSSNKGAEGSDTIEIEESNVQRGSKIQ
jgi:hypothetical protein